MSKEKNTAERQFCETMNGKGLYSIVKPLIVVFMSTLSSKLCRAISNSAGVKGDW